jgi:hypothetical protein
VRPPSGVQCPCPHPSSNDHLRNALPAQRLTRRKLLLLQPRERIESRSDQQHDRSRDQARRVADDGEELDDAHDEVDGGAHVVCLEAADEGVEVLGCRADAQQQRDFDEDEDEGGDAGVEKKRVLVGGLVWDGTGLELGWDGQDDIQAKHTPQDDDVEVEDVCDSEGEAEDDAEDAGPEVGYY